MTSGTPGDRFVRAKLAPVAASQSLELVRRVGLSAWGMVGLTTALRSAPEIARAVGGAPAGPGALVASLFWSTLALPWLLFGAGFWWSTGRPVAARVSGRAFAVLLAGAACAALVNTDLLLLLAIQAPLLLPGAAAVAWMGGQSLLTLAAGLSIAGTPEFEPLWCGDMPLPRHWLERLTIAALVVWQWLAFAVGTMAARESRAHAELSRLHGDLRATQGLLAESARLAERLDISRELHDAVGHHLTALSVNLDLAARRLEGEPAEAVREAHAVTRLLLGEVRQIVGRLRDVRPLDLSRALRTLGAAVAEPRVEVVVGEGVVVEAAQAHALYRCAQEALTNAVRHARATRLTLGLARVPEGVRLEVSDDGRGTAAVVPGTGLRGMRERVEELGGTLETESAPRGGFRLRVTLPSTGGGS